MEYLQSASTAMCRGVCLAPEEQLIAAESAMATLEAHFCLLVTAFIACAASRDFE